MLLCATGLFFVSTYREGYQKSFVLFVNYVSFLSVFGVYTLRQDALVCFLQPGLRQSYFMLLDLYLCVHLPAYRTLASSISPRVGNLVLPLDSQLRRSLRRQESCVCAPQ